MISSICYITTVNSESDPGVFKKIQYQCKEFERAGLKVVLGYFNGNDYVLDDKVIFTQNRRMLQALKERFIFNSNISSNAQLLNVDAFYIRKPFVSLSFVSFVKRLKRANKKVVLEIPTYPYYKEFDGFYRKLLYCYERFSALFIGRYLDFITYYGEVFEKIWGTESIRLENAILPEMIKVKSNIYLSSNKLRMIAVGNLAKWHGYERLILGISNLDICERNNFHLDIVGDGHVKEQLENIVKDKGLDEYITFHGTLKGKQLDDIFERANVGVGSLGMYKIGLQTGSTLKAREFCARGIPFILGYNDLSFSKSVCDFFIYEVTNDSKAIDLMAIQSWYQNISVGPLEIRKFAIDNLTWSQQVEKVIDKLNSVTGDD